MTCRLVIILMLLALAPGCVDGNADTEGVDSVSETPQGEPVTMAAVAQPDPYRQVFDDMLEVWTQMGDILAEVKDLPSADQAAPKMRAAFDRSYEVLVRAEQLPPPPPEKADALLAEYMPLKEDALEMYEHHLFRIGRLDQAILDAFERELQETKPLPDVEWTYID